MRFAMSVGHLLASSHLRGHQTCCGIGTGWMLRLLLLSSEVACPIQLHMGTGEHNPAEVLTPR